MSSQLTRSLHVNKMKVVKYPMTTRTKTSRDDNIPKDLEAKVEIELDNNIPKDLEAKVEFDKLEELEAKAYGQFHHSKYLNKGLIKTFASSCLSLLISLWIR